MTLFLFVTCVICCILLIYNIRRLIYGRLGIKATSGDSTQLIYLRARFYNPANGRFQSRDTWDGSYNSPQSLNRWNYTQSNPINYTDPSGNYCIAGFDIDFLGGDKCTDTDRNNAIDTFHYFEGYINSPSFVLGVAYEVIDSAMIVGPETARLAWSLILKSSPVLDNLATTAAVTAALCGNNGLLVALNLIKNGVQGDHYFRQGRAIGRSIALAYALNQVTIGGGGTLVAAALGPFTIGISLFATPVTVGITAYGAAVMANIAVKELSDHIIWTAITKGNGRAPSTILANNMAKANPPRPRPANSHAHHIVGFKEELAEEARRILKRAGIDLNEEINGAWLPNRFHEKLKDSYYDQVNVIMRKAEADGTVKQTLRWLGERIETGYFP